MTAYRIAVLHGNSRRLSACSVSHYRMLTATSYREALKLAARLNALVIACYPSKGGQQ